MKGAKLQFFLLALHADTQVLFASESSQLVWSWLRMDEEVKTDVLQKQDTVTCHSAKRGGSYVYDGC